jgi:hypothetical protein
MLFFLNLKLHSFIEINYFKIIHCCFFLFVQESKTNLHVVVALPLSNVLPSTSCLERTPLLRGGIALDKPALRGGACAFSAYS